VQEISFWRKYQYKLLLALSPLFLELLLHAQGFQERHREWRFELFRLGVCLLPWLAILLYGLMERRGFVFEAALQNLYWFLYLGSQYTLFGMMNLDFYLRNQGISLHQFSGWLDRHMGMIAAISLLGLFSSQAVLGLHLLSVWFRGTKGGQAVSSELLDD
jgi:NADH:ubiquinone oxidoreductase subunit K